MLIKNADIYQFGHGSVRIAAGRIVEMGPLPALPGEDVIEAGGGALLPGLHDHHIHLCALAVRDASVSCGPPDVNNECELAAALGQQGEGWLRGVGFCETTSNGRLPDAIELDRMAPDRPLRLQHRTGRMWFLNSAGLDILLASSTPPPGLERENGKFTGRLFDEDAWLRNALANRPPDLRAISQRLAAFGVTGLTDMSAQNGPDIAGHFDRQVADRHLVQNLVLAGTLELADAKPGSWALGPAKLHLHEAALPNFQTTVDWIRRAHAGGRSVAVHCVTEVELVFTLALFDAAGTRPGDRIEHLSIAALSHLQHMHDLSLIACVQPHFIAERGDRYRAEVEPRHQSNLYRLRSVQDAGLAMCGGSDAPYGTANPWAAMVAAVNRTTETGAEFGPAEALGPDQALALYLADPVDLQTTRRVAPSQPADLCLLDRPWHETRHQLAQTRVMATWISGQLVHKGVDQAPFHSGARG